MNCDRIAELLLIANRENEKLQKLNDELRNNLKAVIKQFDDLDVIGFQTYKIARMSQRNA